MKLCTTLLLFVWVVAADLDQEYDDQVYPDDPPSSTTVPPPETQNQTVSICQVNVASPASNEPNPRVNSEPDLTGSRLPAPGQRQHASFNRFYGDLYQKVKRSHSANFALSPLSLRNSLALLSLGAMDETAEEIQRVLQFPADAKELMSNQSQLISSLKRIPLSTSGLKFVTGDGIFATYRIRLKNEFKQYVGQLRGDIERVNFTNGDAVAGRINAWVHNKTDGKIDQIVEPMSFNQQISLLILNTIYFKGLWEHQFEVADTKQSPFFINGSCSMNVDMMTQTNEFQLADLDDAKAQVLLLPYKGERLSMMIYLPFKTEESSLGFLENWLKDKSPFDIQNQYLSEPHSRVSVSLPKFKIRSSLQLNEPLKSLGLRKMFDAAKGNFSGIFNDSKNFFVSKMFQETFVEVNEEGTEAAAVTGSELVAVSVALDFTADRPFLFQIVDNETNTVLFSGRVQNPLDFTNPSNSAGENPQCLEDALATRTCVPKPEVEEMMLDFVNFLTPKETEPSNVQSRVSRLQMLVETYGNETAGTMTFLQSMNSTLDNLEKTEEELEDIKEASTNKGRRVRELEQEREELRRTERQLTTSIETQADKIRDLELKDRTTEQTMIQLGNEIHSQNLTINWLKGERERLQRNIRELEQKERTFKWTEGQLRNELDSQNQTINRLKKDAEEAEKELQRLLGSHNSQAETIRELEQKERTLKWTEGQLRTQFNGLREENEKLRNTLTQRPVSCPREYRPSTAAPRHEATTTAGFPQRLQTQQVSSQNREAVTSPQTPVVTTTQRPEHDVPKEEQSSSVKRPAAAAWIYKCSANHCVNYNITDYREDRDGRCKRFSEGIHYVALVESCVIVYTNALCTGRSFQLNKTYSDKITNVRQQFPNTGIYNTWYSVPKSIGPC